jgi:hypothetical protein
MHSNYFLVMSGCHGSTRLLGAGHVSKKDGAYFGPPKPETGLTRTFPKTMHGELDRSGEQFQYTDKRKDTVPAKDDRPILGMTTTKNFITANAVEAILQGEKSLYLCQSIYHLFSCLCSPKAPTT